MQRSMLIGPFVGLVATLIVGPILATVALAADPVVVVQEGDNLTRLSKRHGVSIATLVDLNNLTPLDGIFVLMNFLRIPLHQSPITALWCHDGVHRLDRFH